MPEQELVEAENEISEFEKGAVVQKLMSRIRWGLSTPYVGVKGGSVREAVNMLSELGYSKGEILAGSVGTEKALEILKDKELKIF